MGNGRESPAWSNSTCNARTQNFSYNHKPHSGIHLLTILFL